MNFAQRIVSNKYPEIAIIKKMVLDVILSKIIV